jgi:hypothetical protein
MTTVRRLDIGQIAKDLNVDTSVPRTKGPWYLRLHKPNHKGFTVIAGNVKKYTTLIHSDKRTA